MKTKKLFLMATMLLMSVCSFAQNSNTPLKGDVNGDGKVDVADIVAILKIMKDAVVTTYTVTYHSNGGNSTPAPQTVNAGQTITLASAISRNADSSYTYSFAGWNTNSNGTGTNYNAGTSYTVNGNINLYAKWNKTEITPVTPTTEYYFSVGTTAPTASNYTTANNATTTIPTTKEFTNNSGSKSLIYILVPSNKTVTATDLAITSIVSPLIEDTSITIPNHKLYVTDGKIANGGGIKITIS